MSKPLPCPFELRVPPRTPPDAAAVARDLVIHAPDKTGDAALCGRPTSPDKILASGPFDAVDCPTCAEMLRHGPCMLDACAGAVKARARLAERIDATPWPDLTGDADADAYVERVLNENAAPGAP